MMKMSAGLIVLAAACGVDGGTEPPIVDPPIVDPPVASAIGRCLAEGGALKQLWATSNQHGPVTSIAVGGSTIVLGSADGSVKIWNVNGSSPSYGTPFLDDTGIVVDAIAFADDGQVFGGDRQGRLSEWRLADSETMRTIPVGEDPLETIALSPDGSQAAVGAGPLSPAVRIINRANGAVGAPLPTTLWGVRSIAYGTGGELFTAGHWYGVPMIERRSIDEATEVVDEWKVMSMTGHVHGIAVDSAVTRLAAAGDDFVGVFDPHALETGVSIIRPVVGHRAIDVALLGTDVVASAGEEGTLRLWSATTVEPLAQLEIPEPVGLGVSGDGATLFTSGPDGILRAFGCR